MDFLAWYLQKLTDTRAIRLPYRGMRPCLLYADDVLLFLKPNTNQARTIKIELLVFQEISGLSVNMHKLEVILINVQQQQQPEELVRILGCKVANLPFTYLGIPSRIDGCLKQHISHLFKNSTRDLRVGWQDFFLWQGGWCW